MHLNICNLLLKKSNVIQTYKPSPSLNFGMFLPKRLIPISNSHNTLPVHQFGFRHLHSAIQQGLQVINTIFSAIENKYYCSAVFLDVTEAFDRVWHPGLLFKLKSFFHHTQYLILNSFLLDHWFKLLHKAGFAPRLYATFKNGLAYEFVPGNVINVDTVKAPTIYPLIASMMAKIHTVHRDMNASPCLWYKIEKQLKLIPSVYTSKNKQLIFEETFPNGIEFLWKEFVLLKSILSKENSPIVFCHNDLLLANIIHQGNKITFIDYEYASCNYQAYDIGNHFAEFSGVTEMDYSLFPGEDFQRSWLRIYLEEYYNITSPSRVVSEEDVSTLYQQVNRFVLASHLYWATWALVQGQHSSIDFDFIRYGAERMKEYEIRKRKVL
ncbi:ethanolamine kinase isoform X2 [Cimex lectularius]|uniref:ethanolamine kinase n=1 Tax=Cimex lectularius TaxID=79782 RepID=A0A8I6SQI1_CIMLE|nr:ethanolamine kinase isoform X2 [Cimex lectularius]